MQKFNGAKSGPVEDKVGAVYECATHFLYIFIQHYQYVMHIQCSYSLCFHLR